jgi:hypothetical protein
MKLKTKILNKLTDKPKPIRCYWCNRKATRRDYRTIDGTTGLIPSCNICFGLDTGYLLERRKFKRI